MKKLYTILASAAVTIFMVGCQNLNTLPEFEESESFASFPTLSFGIDENGGQVRIPVQIASLKPVNTVVSYEIVDGTAKAGVNFKDTNPDAVLSFPGSTWEDNEQYIVIDIIDKAGEYTGDLSFTVNILSATGLKISAENTCKVDIYDLDHPLAPILGSYSGSAVSSYDGAVSWTMNLLKDAKDVKVVWIDGLTDEVIGEKLRVYANVNYDEQGNITGYTIPAGQYLPYSSSYTFWIVGNKAGSGSYYPNASLTWKFENGTFTFDGDEPNSLGVLAVSASDNTSIAGWWNRYDVPPSYTKK
ncbi:MAG: hypothetical protein IJU68_03740 [Bacteroidales bacterium]|nr:hypothetical protein [Bacteroidales bacterium]